MKNPKYEPNNDPWIAYAISAVVIVVFLLAIVFGAVDPLAEVGR